MSTWYAIMGLSRYVWGREVTSRRACYNSILCVLHALRYGLHVPCRVPRQHRHHNGGRFTMTQGRKHLKYRKHWSTLITRYGVLCYYCHEEVSSTIDHVVPYNWDGDDSLENLVPACFWCNAAASDKIFDSVQDKKEYILKKRARRRAHRHCVCSECLLPFAYLEQSPSQFLCPECWDRMHGTDYSSHLVWQAFLPILELAGFVLEAHRYVALRFWGSQSIGRYDRFMVLNNEISRILEREAEYA